MKNTYQVSSQIYNSETINQAIIDFGEIADIEFKEETLTIQSTSTVQSDRVFNEFMNYVLSI